MRRRRGGPGASRRILDFHGPHRRMTSVHRVIALVAGLVGLAGCGGTTTAHDAAARQAHRVRFPRTGLSISVPAGWHVATRLTALAQPVERFTIASYPLIAPAPADRGCGPRQTIARIPANGALAFVWE